MALRRRNISPDISKSALTLQFGGWIATDGQTPTNAPAFACGHPLVPTTALRLFDFRAASASKLQDEHLRQLLARLDKVPTVPSLYVELMEKLQDPEIDADAIAETVLKDPAMTAQGRQFCILRAWA
jgi:glutaredoxin-related protein